jgi:hypothetical protein
MQQYKARTTTPGIVPGSWLSVLLGAVAVLIQRQHQLGIARAGQYIANLFHQISVILSPVQSPVVI